jgi:hypothetical protein
VGDALWRRVLTRLAPIAGVPPPAEPAPESDDWLMGTDAQPAAAPGRAAAAAAAPVADAPPRWNPASPPATAAAAERVAVGVRA